MGDKHVIEIVETDTGLVVKEIDVTAKSDRQREKVDDGLQINLNHDRYFTRLVRRRGFVR